MNVGSSRALLQAGPLIGDLSECVNQLEAVSVRVSCGNPIDYVTITKQVFLRFPEVIEVLGGACISVEEATMLADCFLNMCRVGISFVPSEVSHTFTSNAYSLLCVILTGPFLTDKNFAHTLFERVLKIISLVGPSDPHCPSLWQCFLKLLAKCSLASDESRVVAFQLMISHADVAINHAGALDVSKWINILKAGIKLNKYVFRKQKLTAECSYEILKIVKALPVDHEVVPLLLTLPVRSLGQAGKDMDFDSLAECLQSCSFTADSLGSFLLRSRRRLHQWRDLLSSKALTEPRVAVGITKSLSVPKRFETAEDLLSLALSTWSTPRPKQIDEALAVFIPLLLGWSESPQPSRDFHLAGHIFRRLLMTVKTVDLVRYSILDQAIIVAHMPPHLLKSPLVKSLFQSFSRLVELLLEVATDVDIAFWPLLAMIKICSESAQPSYCAQLKLICQKALIPGPRHIGGRLLNLLGDGLLLSIKFLEPPGLDAIIGIHQHLPNYSAFMIMTACLLSSSTSPGHRKVLNSHLKEALKRVFPAPDKQGNPHLLRCCEVFLKLASDVSVFEEPELAYLHQLIVTFLKREGPAITNSLVATVADAVSKRLVDLVKPPDLRFTAPTVLRTKGLLDELVKDLDQQLLMLQAGDEHDFQKVLGMLESVISKYK